MKRIYRLLKLFCLFFFLLLLSFCELFPVTKTYITMGGNITDNGTRQFTKDITDSGTITEIEYVAIIELNHTNAADIEIYITSPDNTEVCLIADYYGTNDFDGDYYFNDDGANGAVVSGGYVLEGTFQPIDSLSDFEGEDIEGVWTLRVVDDTAGETGYFSQWHLRITYE